MTEPFISGNGRIRLNHEQEPFERIDIYTAVGGENMLEGAPWLGRDEVGALREFFLRERDEANGVWRSQIDPAWTAVHEDGYPTVQFRNDDGMREFSIYPDRSNMHAWSPELQQIGLEYIETHPERKARPWSEARFITWRNGAYLPQTAQRDLGGMNLGWWYGTGVGDEAWHSEDALAEIIGDADVTVLVTEDAP